MRPYKISIFFSLFLNLGFTQFANAQAVESCNSKCAELKARLATLNCVKELQSISSLLEKSRAIVTNIGPNIRDHRDQVIAFNGKLREASTVIGDCLFKHKDKLALIDAMGSVATLDDSLAFWTRKNEVPKQAVDILIKQYADAEKSLSKARASW